ncbi:GEVED domain-containing protein [Tenacibaculum maritimum]|uniref:GEVED domain-containing protein n=2 Tax=Tenacibaculum maritimum TaxID=107401 RepID=UPI0012E5D40D|nr:GEVED domain-containing protein [Tenacibaculum maritimum]CAA0185679.1 Probable M43 family metalloprotease precursor containing a C-terminal secretion signal [Tenacibaculum maritimum]
MKNKITLAFLSLLFIGVTYAQDRRTCHAMENLEYRKSLDPELKRKMAEIERFTQRKITEKERYHGKVSGEIITLPVVVHILYTNSTNNISDAQIQSQLDVLNADFRRTNSDATNKWSQAADTQIEFKLATIDPNGNPTTGITRTAVSTATWGTNDAMKKTSTGGVNTWNTAEYLNMWIVDNIKSGSNTILGYAQFPGGDASTDGVVMADQYFGTVGTAQAPFDGGRTTTHEVGHYLNLRHIWGDGPCGSDDFVADTPESDAPNYGCVTGHNSCGSEDMVQNYMDYSDDSCMNLFTVGQKNRMRAILEAGGSRRSLALSDKFGEGATCTATVPTGVATSGVTSSSVSVTWSSVSGATYSVRYRIAGSTSWVTKDVASTSTTLSGLSASTQYEIQVRSKCTSGNSNYSASVSVTTSTVTISYCTSKGENVSDEYIQRVELGSIDNSSDGGNGYSDYTSISTDLIKGVSNTIKITPKWNGTVYSEGYGVWIDYNGDGDFSDAGETVWTKAPSKDATVSGSFRVPSSALEGSTRMRVVLKYNGTPSACEGSISYGEVEDYTIRIVGANSDTQSPTAPTGLSVSNITQTTATLSWLASTDNVGVKEYEVFNGGSSIGVVTGTSANITGLTANTTYSYSVKSKDAAGNVSESSSSLVFTTLGVELNYCSSKGNRSTYEWIDYVSLGGMSHSSSSDGGYGDFTSKVANVSQGSTNQLIVSAGFRSSSYTEFFTVWIDFNQNGVFESSEEVVSGSSRSSSNRTAEITIPSSAKLGSTRMRVSMKYNSKSTPCESFADGEVEDYTVNITAAGTSRDSEFLDIEALGNESADYLAVFPNPTTSYVKITLRSAKGLTYKIVNTIGQVVKAGVVNDVINVSKLKSGLYILEVNDGQKSKAVKLMKR